jgi:hypothetical protein
MKIQCTKCLYFGQPILCPFIDYINDGAEVVVDGVTIISAFFPHDGKENDLLLTINKQGHCGSPRFPQKITDDLVSAVREWLGEDGINFFQSVKESHGRIDAIWNEGGIPHAVHFREGMEVRNFMRSTGKVDHWSCRDLDDLWIEVVEKAIEPEEITDSIHMEDMVEEMKKINQIVKRNNELIFERMADLHKVVLRLYELAFFGLSDVIKEDYRKELMIFLIESLGKEKFDKWMKKAGTSNRDWSFLYDRPNKSGTA